MLQRKKVDKLPLFKTYKWASFIRLWYQITANVFCNTFYAMPNIKRAHCAGVRLVLFSIRQCGRTFLRSQPLVRCFALYLNPFQAHILQKNHRILVQDTNSSRERTLRKSNTDRNTKFNQQHLIQSRKKVQLKTQRTVVPQKSFMNNQHYHGRTVMVL